jgi:cardiolipin synthase
VFVETLLAIVTILFHTAGGLFALQGLLISRTPQAAIGWALALITFPYAAIPLFLVFGESRFSGYPHAGNGDFETLDGALKKARQALEPYRANFSGRFGEISELVEPLTRLPTTRGNHADLLIDGEATFDAICTALDRAETFVLIQFFIFRDDSLGLRLQRHILAARARGVSVHLLIDQVGSRKLGKSYRATLQGAGVILEVFITNRDRGRRFRMNFRNHRKLVIVDGREAYLGGLNVGDEYLGLDPKFGPWRDTFMRLTGPVVRSLQMTFVEDWFFTTREVLDLPWEIAPPSGDMLACPIPTGPDRPWKAGPAAYLEIIQSARHRLWFATPYFVPENALVTAIAHAAIRGVEVRLLLPQMADHVLPWLSSFTFYPGMRAAGVKIYRYQPGFMHQKVVLADDNLAVVGSINVDYRSFMLNFELSTIVESKSFAAQVERMFLDDFARSAPADMYAYENANVFFKLKCRAAALLSSQQ